MRRASLICAAAIAACQALAAAPALAADPPPVSTPDALQQPLDDGCHRNPVGFLDFTEPEWVFVDAHESFNPNPAKARLVEATAHSPDLAAGDLPESHNSYDFNSDVELDPAYQYLAGGDPAAHNGNYAPDMEGRLHIEWESLTFPSWDWPTDRDRLKAWGSWVWDCGHWGQGFTADPDDPTGSAINDTDYFLPGTNQTAGLRGEQTEFHPFQFAVVTRARPYLPQVGETETDVFGSSDGTPAYAESKCALEHPAATNLTYGPDYVACANLPQNDRQPVNDRDYTFFVPAPPKPDPNAHLRYRVVDHDPPGSGPQEVVQPRANGLDVTVPFNGFGNDTQALGYGKSFFVGWDGAVQNIPAHLQLDLKQLKVFHSLDDPTVTTSTQVPPGEYGVYLDVNGNWMYLNDLAPGLGSVNDNQTFDLNRTLDLYVPAGQEVRVFVDSRECDLPKIAPCQNTPEAAEDNDVPGSAADSYTSAEDAVGDHVLKAPSPTDPNFQLSYSIRELSSATTGTPPTCKDTFSPRSRVAPKRSHLTPRRLRVRGRAHDRRCSGTGKRVAHVDVSVAKRLPGHVATSAKRCRYLKPNGHLGRRASCKVPAYLRAHGRLRWRLAKRHLHLTPGRYLVRSRAIDVAGNYELPGRRNRARLAVKRSR